MLRNDAMTSMDRLQPGLFFCLCTRPRKFGTGARSDAVCRSHRSQALFRGEWLRLQSRKASMTDRTQPEITPNTPLPLADAVKIAFPMGGMTTAGLLLNPTLIRLIIDTIPRKEFP